MTTLGMKSLEKKEKIYPLTPLSDKYKLEGILSARNAALGFCIRLERAQRLAAHSAVYPGAQENNLTIDLAEQEHNSTALAITDLLKNCTTSLANRVTLCAAEPR